ncbi:MAG: hypothetical protein ACYS5W_12835 [Planctomycetota bacterium]
MTPYDPARLELQTPVPEDTEQRVLKVLRHHGYRLGEVQRDPLRVRTRWSHHQRAEVPGWKRAAVFLDERFLDEPATLNVVVEVRYLNIGLFGKVYETEVSADRNLEQVLIEALRDAFQ